MFNNRTVLILGAGASKPFGYPLGAELIDNIASGIRRAIYEEIPSISLWKQSEADFVKDAYPSIITYAEKFCDNKLSRGDFETLAKLLATAAHQSIDDFARTNPRFRQLIKSLVALEIAKATFDGLSLRGGVASVNQTYFGRSAENWYSRLVSRITEDCDSAQDCYDRNFLSVITFNYDRSLEHYLDQYLAASDLFSGLQRPKLVAPFHMHGSLDISFKQGTPFPEQLGRQLMECNFSIMGEARTGSPDPTPTARAMLNQAERVYVLGFDFHRSNVELLGLKETGAAKKIIALNFDGSPRFDSRARAAGISSDNIWHPRDGMSTYSIAKAIDNGLFETAP